MRGRCIIAAMMALAGTGAARGATEVPPAINVDCVAERENGRPVAAEERRLVHYQYVGRGLDASTYAVPLDARSREAGAGLPAQIIASTDEALVAADVYLVGESSQSEMIVIYRRAARFVRIVTTDPPFGMAAPSATVETGTCRGHPSQ